MSGVIVSTIWTHDSLMLPVDATSPGKFKQNILFDFKLIYQMVPYYICFISKILKLLQVRTKYLNIIINE